MNRLTIIFIALLLSIPCVLHVMASDVTPGQRLLEAAHNGNSEETTSLLKANPGIVNTTDSQGLTSLHRATIQGHIAIVRLLLENHANINAIDEDGYTPLHYVAILHNNEELIELLLKYKANIGALTEDDNTPLHLAAWSGYTEVAKCLLKNQADANAQDEEGNTPLHEAIIDSSGILSKDPENRADIIALLLTYGADTYIKNKANQSPFDIAAQATYKGLVNLIQQARQFAHNIGSLITQA